MSRPVQFRNTGLVDVVLQALASSGLAPNRLELEITEGVLLTEHATTLPILHQLHGLGVRVAMDDFGTGYSSMGYLRSFPFDKIKIDRSFIASMSKDANSLAIIRAVAGLGSSLGIATTAEGVETRGGAGRRTPGRLHRGSGLPLRPRHRGKRGACDSGFAPRAILERSLIGPFL